MDLPRTAGEWLAALAIPWPARLEAVRDHVRGPLHRTPPTRAAVARAAMQWLCTAQDRSTSKDGGIARHYSLLDGWGESYPETTGYIVPTFVDWARVTGDPSYRDRARRMLDWLVSIQLPSGAFAGGTISQVPRVPVTFNTGQILLGLAAGAREWPEFLRPMRLAADWLCETQDVDGAWRQHPSPFAKPDEKAYETHVAWGLFEAARVAPGAGYETAGLANVRWALRQQEESGWFRSCCLDDATRPLTHTIGYALRGVIEAYRLMLDPAILAAALRCAEGARSALQPTGFLPGRLDSRWNGSVTWTCLTGNTQIAICWLLLAELTQQDLYRKAATSALDFVRRTICLDGHEGIRGGVKGSFPVNGGYCWWEFVNWGSKFLVDASLLEAGTSCKVEMAAAL